MMRMFGWMATAVTVAAILGCAGSPQAPSGGAEPAGSTAQPAFSNRSMTMVSRYEVTDLAPKITGSSSPMLTKRLFNAALVLYDGDVNLRPYLAESVPQLNTESWQVLPDGRMETTWKLRPGLTWHDGQPLTADDFVFAFQVYSSPALTTFIPVPQDKMEDVVAVDPQTVLIKWKALYPDANALIMGDFDPLPRHILQDSFGSLQDPAAFLNQTFWTVGYVGAGPYRLEQWTPGSEMVGASFEGHALGKPKIERVILKIIGDENTVLTNVLAGTVDFTLHPTLRFEQAQLLRKEWVSAGKGQVFLQADSPQFLVLQFRSQYLGQPALQDVRVRRAILYTMDRRALNEGLFDGEEYSREIPVAADASEYAAVEQAVTKYGFDPRQAAQLMTVAGYTKDRDGMYANPAGERLTTDVKVTAGAQFERGNAILIDAWRQNGFDMTGSVVAAAEARDREARQTFPGMASRGASETLRIFLTSEIGAPSNRWLGDNRGGWSNADYDRLYDTYAVTLDHDERMRQYAQLMKVLSDELPAYTLYFQTHVVTSSAALRGPTEKTIGTEASRGTLPYWNIHEWERM